MEFRIRRYIYETLHGFCSVACFELIMLSFLSAISKYKSRLMTIKKSSSGELQYQLHFLYIIKYTVCYFLPFLAVCCAGSHIWSDCLQNCDCISLVCKRHIAGASECQANYHLHCSYPELDSHHHP